MQTVSAMARLFGKLIRSPPTFLLANCRPQCRSAQDQYINRPIRTTAHDAACQGTQLKQACYIRPSQFLIYSTGSDHSSK